MRIDSEKTVGVDLFARINEPTDPKNLSNLEKRHMPLIDAPETIEQGAPVEITVAVGEMLRHPAEPGHFIQCIELYADQIFLGRADLAPALTCPKVSFCIIPDRPVQQLIAYARCNLHGTWVGRKRLIFAK